MTPHRHRFPLLSKPEAPELGKASSRPWESVCVCSTKSLLPPFLGILPSGETELNFFFPNIR